MYKYTAHIVNNNQLSGESFPVGIFLGENFLRGRGEISRAELSEAEFS